MEGISVFSGDFRLSDFGAGRGKQRLGGYAIFWLGWKGNYVSLRKLSPRFPRPGAIIMAPLRAHICAAILRARNDFARFSTFHIWGWNVGVGAEGFVLSLGLFWLFFRELSLELAGRGARLDKGWGVCDFLVWLEGELYVSSGAVTPPHASGGDHRVAAAPRSTRTECCCAFSTFHIRGWNVGGAGKALLPTEVPSES